MKTEKLKTLKDLEENDEGHKLVCAGDVYLSKNRIKAEAVKWVKAMRNKGHTYPHYYKAIEEFKQFFNLTEEDLK